MLLNRKQILDDAANAVLRDRNATHGKPENSFGTIAKLWSIILDKQIEPHQVALCMDALKTARIIENPTNPDNWIDKAGYAACGGELADPHEDMLDIKDRILSNTIWSGPETRSGAYHPTRASVSYISKDLSEHRIAYIEDHEEIAKRGVITVYLDLPHECTEDEAVEFGKKFIREKRTLVQI